MMEAKSEIVSLEPDALQVGASREECSLLGNRCPRCVLVFFPRRHFCTRCCNPGLEEIQLSRKGRLRSFTTAYQKPNYAQVEPPYLIGEIELLEGVVIYSLLTQCSPKELKVGEEMELATIQVREENREGKRVTVLAYAFRPG